MPAPVQTLAQLFAASVAHNKADQLLVKRGDAWRPMSSAEFYRRVGRLHLALGRLGLRRGDCCALLSENRWEWAVADFAMMTAGIVSVPIYPTLTAEQIHYLLADSASRSIFVSGMAQREKIDSIRKRLPSLDNILSFETAGSGPLSRVFSVVNLIGNEPLQEDERKQLDAAIAAVRPEDLASIIYTSGTTGTPKGVMLTHSNIVSNVRDSAPEFHAGDVALSFLPLCHIYERTLDYAYYAYGITVAHCGSIEAVPEALQQVRPTLVAAVPRFFEKSYRRVMDRMAEAPPLRQKLFQWALKAGFESLPYRTENMPLPFGLKLKLAVADRLVFSKLRERLGGRIRQFFSGAAPLARELMEFFWAVGLPVLEGYGLTETAPVVACNRLESFRFGTVGKPLRNVEVRLADDGEILVRGPNVMKGYYNKAQETAEAFDDGWFRTGDIGRIDADGFLSIIDRKKDLLKTSGGKYVTPQPIENKLRNNPYIADAVVIAEGRKFPSALIIPNFAQVERYARERGISYGSTAELARHPQVVELLEEQVRMVCSDLAQYEQIKKIAVLEREFTIEAGEITPSLKVRRREVERRYQDVIERIYAEVAAV